MTEDNLTSTTRRTFLAGVGGAGIYGTVGSAAAVPGRGSGFPPRGRTEYGESAPMGAGEVTPFVAEHPNGKWTAVGVELSAAAATIDETEYDEMQHAAIDFPGETVFEFLGLDWMPEGHGPPAVYGVPHFDVHFYLDSQAEVAEIPPVNYPPYASTDDPYDVALTADQVPEGYFRTNYVVPAMGEHYFDATAPEWSAPGEPSGEDFTHTFVWGHWDGDLTFFEPMVTTEFLGSLDGVVTESITTPDRMPEAGAYPTEYSVAYHRNRDAYTITLGAFEPFEASEV